MFYCPSQHVDTCDAKYTIYICIAIVTELVFQLISVLNSPDATLLRVVVSELGNEGRSTLEADEML